MRGFIARRPGYLTGHVHEFALLQNKSENPRPGPGTDSVSWATVPLAMGESDADDIVYVYYNAMTFILVKLTPETKPGLRTI